MDILRFLLPFYSHTTIATFAEEGLFRKLSIPDNDDDEYSEYKDGEERNGLRIRRAPLCLLLRAGAPLFLRPDDDLFKKSIYITRRGALLAIFSPTVKDPPTILIRIRHGAGGAEIIRTIIGVL